MWDYNQRMALVKPQGTYSTIVINEWKKIILVACINTAYINQQSKSDSSEMVLLLFVVVCMCMCIQYESETKEPYQMNDSWIGGCQAL